MSDRSGEITPDSVAKYHYDDTEFSAWREQYLYGARLVRKLAGIHDAAEMDWHMQKVERRLQIWQQWLIKYSGLIPATWAPGGVLPSATDIAAADVFNQHSWLDSHMIDAAVYHPDRQVTIEVAENHRLTAEQLEHVKILGIAQPEMLIIRHAQEYFQNQIQG